LIPAFGLKGAICAAIVGTIAIDLLAITGLLRYLGRRFLAMSMARLGAALAISAALVAALRNVDGNPWTAALAACGVFPLLAAAFGLVPNPRRSQLLRHTEPGDTATLP